MKQNQELRIATEDALDVREFKIEQALSTLFTVTITAVSKNPDIDLEAAIGREASFALTGRSLTGQPLVWRGVLSELHQVRVEESGLSTYHAELRPTLWLASQRRNSRIFQGESELDIAKRLLAEWGVDVHLAIDGTYKSRKYRVQYGETDFDFIARMLEEAGISFYFVDLEDRTVCVLSDVPQQNRERAKPITFVDAPGTLDREYVTEVRVSRAVRPGKLTLRDHDYRRPADHVLGASASASGVEARLESFHYEPGALLFAASQGASTPVADDRGMHRTDDLEGQRLAALRLASEREDAATISFRANVLDLGPGSVVRVLNHPQRELGDQRKLLVVGSRIEGTHDRPVVVRCSVRSAAEAYHPPLRHPKPRAGGAESATVVGPAGEEIHVDEFGRVRVQFHWDREGARDERSSCWIHVSQPWAGSGFGGTNLPRIGQEVIVDFLGGDPDRPVITGRVYTNLQKTPYPLPENKTRSGWRSNSSPAYGGYNELMFEDRAGSELVHLRAQRNLTRQVNNDELSSIGNNRSTSVAQDEGKSVGGNQTETVQGNKSSSTGSDFTEAVLGMFTSLASSDRLLHTHGASTSQANTHSITSDQGTTITVGNSMIHIGPECVIIQTPKLLLNPGDGVAASAALGGPTKLSS